MINNQIKSLINTCLNAEISLPEMIEFYFSELPRIAGIINSDIEMNIDTLNEKNELKSLVNELDSYYNKHIQGIDRTGDSDEVQQVEIRQVKRFIKRLIK